jgi:hypothetical protein
MLFITYYCKGYKGSVPDVHMAVTLEFLKWKLKSVNKKVCKSTYLLKDKTTSRFTLLSKPTSGQTE